MNILLISPFRGALFAMVGVRMQPVGLCYIGSALRDAGHEVRIDAMEGGDDLPDFDGADLVGISCNTVQYLGGLRIAKLATEAGKKVVMGGPHPTSSAADVLATGFVDYIVRGEGEVTVVELLQALNQGRPADLHKVAGLSWVDRTSGLIVHNPSRPFIEDLDSVSNPMREVNWIDGDQVLRGVETDFPITTTRGCPFKCKFCDVKLITGNKFRRRSVGAVLDEVEQLVRDVNPYKIIFTDDLINFDKQRLLDMAAEAERRKVGAEYWVMGRADLLVANPETADAMGRMGVSTMFLGIESPHRHVLEAYGKGKKASAETSTRAVQLLRDNGVETWGAFMLGDLSETMDDMRATIEFARDLNPETAQFTVLTPYPGTELWEEVRGRIVSRNWDLFDCMHSVIRSDHASPAEINELCRNAYLRFYLRPRRLFQKKLRKQHGSRPDLKTVINIVKGMKNLFGDQSKICYETSPLEGAIDRYADPLPLVDGIPEGLGASQAAGASAAEMPVRARPIPGHEGSDPGPSGFIESSASQGGNP